MPTKRATPTRKQPKSASAVATPATSQTTGRPVRIRMYRHGLGDCLLLTFDPGGAAVHMLIDCGSLGATTTGVTLSDVVKDILQTTNRHLHLLVATHEHQDHVCGFFSVQELFKQLKVDNAWLAWTENPADPLAQKIAKYKGDLSATALAASHVLVDQHLSAESAVLGAAVRDILGFAGDPNALGAFAETVQAAMEFVRQGCGANVQYLNPGDLLEPAWVPGFRFYVLGPPRSEDALHDLGEHGSEELYGLAGSLGLAAATAAGTGCPAGDPESDMPFDARFRLKSTDPLVGSFLSDYLSEQETWRRIDYRWLHSAADLALQLDRFTNNTSLTLAIERISDGRVMLLAADAQEGNWISWHDPARIWTLGAGPNSRRITATDLLARCVFYKVGHHGSHNATAKAKGLELMKRQDELIAFIPVDRAVALTRNPKDSWQMPARPLYQRLLEQCQGRVLRSDLGWADDAKAAKNRPVEKEFDDLAESERWAAWKQSQQKVPLTTTPLYFEVTLDPGCE